MKTYQITFLCQCDGMPHVELHFRIKKDSLTKDESIDIFKSTYADKFDTWNFVHILNLD